MGLRGLSPAHFPESGEPNLILPLPPPHSFHLQRTMPQCHGNSSTRSPLGGKSLKQYRPSHFPQGPLGPREMHVSSPWPHLFQPHHLLLSPAQTRSIWDPTPFPKFQTSHPFSCVVIVTDGVVISGVQNLFHYLQHPACSVRGGGIKPISQIGETKATESGLSVRSLLWDLGEVPVLAAPGLAPWGLFLIPWAWGFTPGCVPCQHQS